MDSKQKALATMIVVGGIGFLAVSCSDDDRHEVAHHEAAHEASDAKHEAGHNQAVATHRNDDKKDGHGHKKAVSAPELCLNGKQQSPIDIAAVTITDLPAVQFDYKKSPLVIENTGYTAQVNYLQGSQMVLGDKTYGLYAIDFHSPSEHTIGGKQYDLEAHLIHKNSAGEEAVVAVMFEAGDEASQGLAKLWLNMPEKSGARVSDKNISINAADLLPKDLTYYHYSGSLTGGQCTEGVNWLVMTAPNEMATEQLKQFKGWFADNARPAQSLNDRMVKVSN